MFSFSLHGVTIATVRDIRKKDPLSLCPIRIRVTYQKIQKYYSTGILLTLEDWKKLPSTKSQNLIQKREDINKVYIIIEKHVRDLISNDFFSHENLRKRLGMAADDTVNTAITTKIAKLRNEGKISTSDLNQALLNKIIKFSGNKFEYKQINIKWLQDFEKFLLNEPVEYSTISIYIRTLQKIINEAKEIGIIKASEYPFGKGKYEIPEGSTRKLALQLTQIEQIFKHECETPSIQRCRDLWLFCYICNGANITDVCKFKYSDIISVNNTLEYICFYRIKTINRSRKKRLIRAVLTPEMKSIINLWENKMINKDDFIFPVLTGNESPADERKKIRNITKLINTRMKVLGGKYGIGNITTYTARHSFATVLKRKGSTLAVISESMGHKDPRTTDAYFAQFEDDTLVSNSKLLMDF